MATEKTDVVIVGVGAAGGILAAELGKVGMRVIGLERGPRLATKDFSPQDELRYFQRQDLRPHPKRQPVTWRPNANTRATPIPTQSYGNQAGGGTVHYGSVSWRFHEDDFRVRSQTIERYGVKAIPEDSSVIDWPVSYAELEPYYDRAEYELGVSGKAGNLQGKKIDGGNVFEAPRRREYPLPPLQVDQAGENFEAGGTGRDLRAANKAEVLVIEVVRVEVVERVLLRARPHIDVDMTVVEGGKRPRADVGHEMPAQMPAGIGEAVGKFFRLGQEQQARAVVDERRDDHELRLDRVVRGAVGTVVRYACDAPAVVAVHAVAHGAGDQLEVSGRVRLRQLGDKDRRLGADVAAERLAEAAIAAARASVIRLRDDRARRRERVIAELARGGVEHDARLVHA